LIFPSSLIIGSDTKSIDFLLQSLDQKLTPNNPDIFLVDEYTIDKVREIQAFLSKKPFSHNNKVVIIPQIENLQNEAQNALLKILEEPGPNNYFIITTNIIGKINPTIISRCHQIITPQINQKYLPQLIFDQDATSALSQSEKLMGEKDEFLNFLYHELVAWHQIFINQPTIQHQKILKKILKKINPK